MLRRQTTLALPGTVSTTWRVVDASGIPLGRLAAEVATVLMGKHRPEYTPHVVSGEAVVVINGTKVEMTGRKGEQRLKMRYTEYPGGLKTQTYGQVREENPERLIKDAVRRMLPKNRLARVMLKNLHVYEGTEHPHGGHKPKELKV
ncbi:MAG: 50S ribosomal protein L13 [Phycisphaeraceae bacterium]|nr:MAG: 50S ribosomal protein L13 [Phycisphaeraceae bacterium]